MPLDVAALTAFWTAAWKVGAVLVLAAAVIRFGDSLITRFLQSTSKTRGKHITDNRGKTLAGLLRSALRYTMGTIFLITVLQVAGIDTSALLGGAAILGVAVGFGAQNLVRDIITGFFIIYERQYDVGDYVTAAGVSGIVEEVGLRTTRLRDWSGEVHVIPNGLIEKTTNKSRAGSRALVEIALPYDADIRKATAVMQSMCDQMAKEHPVITDGPVVLGVSKFDPFGVVVEVWARTKPLEHFAVEREMRLRMKEALQGAGIELAHMQVISLPRQDNAQGRGEDNAQDLGNG